MLGIIIGVGAVILIVSLGAGAQSLIVDQVKTLGTDLIAILPWKSENDGPPASAMGIVITTLTYDDALALKETKNVPNVKAVAAYVTGIANISWRSHDYVADLSGTTTGHLDISKAEVAEGRFFTEEEEQNLSKVVVLGSAVKEELFGDSDALGQKIKIKNTSFKVIGVMKEKGKVAFQDLDKQTFVPIRTLQKLVLGIDHVSYIRVKIEKEDNIEQAQEDIKITLREKHDIDDTSWTSDDFSVRSAAEALDVITTVTDSLRFFLAAMAALSLVVGGIGIMNIMLVSVTERTQEIGLRKAVWATNADILMQFLIETITMTVLGGLIGIIGGVLLSVLVATVAHTLEYSWDLVISLTSILVAVGVSMLIGLVFGIYPAKKASQLEPIMALQYE